MAVTITYGLHASACPANTTEAALLLAAAGTEYSGSLRITNLGAGINTYRVAHLSATGAAASKDYLAYDKEIDGNDVHEIGVVLGATEELKYKSGTASEVTFHYSGKKKVTT